MKSLRIGTRLWAAFTIMVALTAAVGGFCLFQLAQVNAGADQLAANWMPSIRNLGDVRAAANGIRRAHLRHLLEVDDSGKSVQEAAAARSRAALDASWQAYAQLISSHEEKAMADEARVLLDRWLTLDDELVKLSNSGPSHFDEARALAAGKSSEAFRSTLEAIGRSVDLNEKGGIVEGERAKSTYESAKLLTACLIAGATAVGLVLAWAITRSIALPLKYAVDAANDVSSGDLSKPIHADGKDETARLLKAFASMQAMLSQVVGEVRKNAQSVATASAQIAQGNQDLSSRTEEQASALQQTAATMEQLGGTVRNNADSAKQANLLAQGAATVAAQGGRVVGQVVGTMQGISASSRKIGDIIGVIDGIAFQTNILALNAAVEAARAGEQGRGFAVVAGEVRTLAQRSAEAAREIKSLINRNVEQVEQGSAQVDQAGKTMNEVVESIRSVSDIVAEITAAAIEQNNGVQQVGEAVGQMDQVTQQNAALVEEGAAAAESLKGQAQQLVQTVAVFKLAHD